MDNNNKPKKSVPRPPAEALQPSAEIPQPQQLQALQSQQPPIMNAVQPPKKSRVGLILGIVFGSLAFVMLITAVLLYFLWWQNPDKMVTDAISNMINTKQAVMSGSIKVTSPEVNVAMDIKSSGDEKNSRAEITLKVQPKELASDIELKLDGIYGDDGAVYVKVDGLNKIVDVALQAYIDTQMPTGVRITQEQINEYKSQIRKFFDPIIKKVDSNWLKISPNDLADSQEAKCMLDLAKDIKENDKYRKEIADAYRKNSWLFVKEGVPAKNGATGFEIDLDSTKMRGKITDFSKEVENSELAKRLKDCGQSDSSDMEDVKKADSDVDGSLRLWVDPWTHNLKSVELKATNKSNGKSTLVEANLDIQPGKTEKIELPTDARDIKEVMEEFQQMFKGGMTSGGYDDYGSSSQGVMI